MWNNYRDKQKRIEICVVVLSTVFTCFGGLCDYFVSKGIIFIEVANLSSVSLNLLQIQAAIITLTITIIALLSGTISYSYMGIPVSKYLLEIRPYILTQKRIIFVVFIGLAISVFCYLLALYNLVIASFFSSMIYVLLSIFDIYVIFNGKKNITFEIETYFKYLADNGDHRAEFGKNFISDWKLVAPEQSMEEYIFYSDKLFMLISAILTNEKQVQVVNSLAEDMSMFLLTHDSTKCKLRGISFVRKFYYKMCTWIENNQDGARKLDARITLISGVDKAWYEAFNSIEAERIEQEGFEFNYFSEAIIRVASWIDYPGEDTSYRVSSVNGLGRALGYYINNQYKKRNVVDSGYWRSIIAVDSFWNINNVPDGSKSFYKESLVIRDFNVFYGFLINGLHEYVNKRFFIDAMQYPYRITEKEYILRIMLIHCFMYYIAYREGQECVDEELQTLVKEILVDNDVIKEINDFYYRVFENQELFDAGIQRRMESILGIFELQPEHVRVKSMIMPDVIKDYYLYVALIINRYLFQENFLENLLDTKKYYHYLIEQQYAELKKRFAEMREIFEDENISTDEMSKKVDDMLFPFMKVMRKKYKKKIMDDASSAQQNYENNNLGNKIQKSIEELVATKLKNIVDGFDAASDDDKTYNRVRIFRLLDYTRDLRAESNRIPFDYAIANFVGWIISKLLKDFELEQINRNKKFDSDEQYRDYLIKHNYDTLLGSQYVFTFSDYKEYKEHFDFLDAQDCKFVAGGNSGLAMVHNSLKIVLNGISVEISSPAIDEIDVYKNEETGLLVYSPLSDLPLEFEEKELEQYLHDARKKIDIYVDVTIGFKNAHENGVIIIR